MVDFIGFFGMNFRIGGSAGGLGVHEGVADRGWMGRGGSFLLPIFGSSSIVGGRQTFPRFWLLHSPDRRDIQTETGGSAPRKPSMAMAMPEIALRTTRAFLRCLPVVWANKPGPRPEVDRTLVG